MIVVTIQHSNKGFFFLVALFRKGICSNMQFNNTFLIVNHKSERSINTRFISSPSVRTFISVTLHVLLCVSSFLPLPVKLSYQLRHTCTPTPATVTFHKVTESGARPKSTASVNTWPTATSVWFGEKKKNSYLGWGLRFGPKNLHSFADEGLSVATDAHRNIW